MENNFYFDESGYKGYLNDKPNENDVCLVAGLLISVSDKKKILEKLTELFSTISINTGEKFHATDIFKDGKNEKIKKLFFEYIKSENAVQIFHSAVYCIGVYNYKVFIQNINEANNVDNSSTHIKTSLNKVQENIYHIPFTSLILKLDAFCNSKCSKLNFITDRVDKSIEKESKKIISEINQNSISSVHTGFDMTTNRVVSKTLTIDVHGFDLGVTHNKELTIDFSNTSLTVAADIIVNSIYRYLKDKIDNGFEGGLNGNDAFKDFELKNKMTFLNDESITDKLYPKNHNRINKCNQTKHS